MKKSSCATFEVACLLEMTIVESAAHQ